MKLPSLSFIAGAFLNVCKRFPSTMLCALTGVIALITVIENSDDDPWIKIWIISQLGLAFCTGLTVWAEARRMAPKFSWALQAGGLGILLLYYFCFDINEKTVEFSGMPRYFGFLICAHLLVAVAPYLNRLPVADFWEYNKQLFANFIIGVVYTLILNSGLSLAILAVNELFRLQIDAKIYMHLFVVLAGIFNTVFFLAHFPAEFQFTDRDKAYNVVFKNLCQYILIPIVGLYFLILYAYSIKILVTWNLPHGWVSSLVLGFSMAGIFTYLINYLLPDYTESKIVHAYRRWFWWILLPLVALLFVAIGRRIADYGITEPRYFVALTGSWLLLLCLYFLWSKQDNIRFIPISLAVFILIGVVGPLSGFEVTKRNQTGILQRLLEQNGRFAQGKLKFGGNPLAGTDADRIYTGMEFLERRDALNRLDNWLPASFKPELDSAGSYENYVARLADSLNIRSGYAAIQEIRSISVYPDSRTVVSGDIGGFRSFHRLELYVPAEIKPGENGIGFNASGTALTRYDKTGKTVVDSFDMTLKLREWKSKSGPDSYYALPAGTEVIELKGAKTTGRLFLQELRFKADSFRIEYLNGILFLK